MIYISTTPIISNPAAPTSKLLGFASSVIRNQQRSVVIREGSLQCVLAVLIDEFLVVGDDRLRDSLTNSVNLRCVSTTSNPDANIDTSELVETDDQERFVDLESQDLGLNEIERLAVDLDESFTSLFPPCQYSLTPLCIVLRTLQWATAVAIHH